MRVTEAEGRLFYELQAELLMLVNRRYRVIEQTDDPEDIMALPPMVRLEIRDALYEHPECFDDFLRTGAPSAADAVEIVAGWRDHHIKGEFYVLRHLKRHTIFLSPERSVRAFGVLGLADPIERLVPHPPAMVSAVLLPFRGRIIYDGFLTSVGPMVRFGGGMRTMFDDLYREAKASFGVITSLPHVVEPKGGTEVDANAHRLKILLKSERSRERHWEEIQDLRDSDPALEHVYHQEIGKADARRIGRSLRACSVTQGWFALYEGLVIASATSRKDLARRVREILPDSKSHLPYLYQLKKKKR